MTRAQLGGLGLSEAQVDAWLVNGWLQSLWRGVYAPGHRALAHRGEIIAALGVGDELAVVRRSAGYAFELTGEAPREIEVSAIAGRQLRHRPGLRVLRLTSLSARDLCEVDGIRCTTVPRTLIDLAGVLRIGELAAVCRRAEFRGLLDLGQLADALSRVARPRGVRALRAIVDPDASAPGRFESQLERRALELLIEGGMPRDYACQEVIDLRPEHRPVRVDLFWAGARLVVEVDGPHHERPLQAAEDRLRDSALRARGFEVVRIPARAVDEAIAPRRFAAELVALHADRQRRV